MTRNRRHANKKDKKKRKKKAKMNTGYKFAEDKANWEALPEGGWRFIGKPKVLTPARHGAYSTDDDPDLNNWRERFGLSQKSYTGGYQHTGGYTSGTTYYDKHNCSHTPDKGVKVGAVTLYPTADKHINATTIKEFDVVMPLLDSTFSMASTVEHYYGVVMWFPIKDFSAPDATKLLLHARRVIDLAKNGSRVAFWCVGSHGRTGTVLATCIGIAEPDIEDPIEETRKRHCKHCVETQSQIECVFHALGREVPEKYRPKSNPVGFTQEGWRQGTTFQAENNWALGCAVCSEKTPMKGCYPMRQVNGQDVYYHLECHQSLMDDEARKRANNAAQGELVTTTQGALPAVETKGDTAPVVDHESFKTLLDKTRPFNASWSAFDATIVADAINDTDTWGDYICVACNRLIIDPDNIIIAPCEDIKGAIVVTHNNCAKFKDDHDADVLCKICCETDVSGTLKDITKDQICAQCAKDGA